VCIPLALARKINLWPSKKVESEEASTAGGEVSIFRIPASAEIQLILDGKIKSKLQCNIIVNPYLDEVLLSDYVIDELSIVPISFRKGLWRHKTDLQNIIRESEQPQYRR
jgi:hypothetical protein